MAAFGRYELVGLLGQGGFATVHRAHDPVLDRDVAIKVLHNYLSGDPQIAERFVREGRALARIRHPNLVQVYDAGEIDGQPFLAMEFVDGQTLAARSEGRQLPLDEAASVISQIAGAIDAVHASGLIHRDIKPANIIVEASGRAVLLDLGIAREMEGTSVTATGLVVGTPGFLAPEQVDSSLFVGPRTDVYQLGATAYTLLAAKPPYEGDTAQVLYSVAHKPPPDLGAARPDLPYQVVAAVNRALAKDPASRPETATALADAFTAGPTLVFAPLAAATAPTVLSGQSEAAATTVVAGTSGPEAAPPAQAATAVAGAPQSATAATPPIAAASPSRGNRRGMLMAGGIAVAVIGAVAVAFAVFHSGNDSSQASPATPEATADAFGDIHADGKPIQAQFGPGAPASLAFRAPASGVASFNVEDSTAAATYSVKDGRDKTVASRFIPEKGGFFEPVSLAAGDYTLQISGEKAGSASLAMYQVPKPGDKTMKPGGTADFSVNVPGATDRISFDVKAGQRFSISIPKASSGFNLMVSPSDAPQTRTAGQWVPEGGGFIDAFEARQDGSLVITADPPDKQSLAATVKLINLSDDKTFALAFATPTTFSTTQPGENVKLTFDGKADQVVSLRTTKVQTGSNLRLREAGEENDLKAMWSPSPTGVLMVVKLPIQGQYVLIVDPNLDTLESGTITLYDVTERPSAGGSVGGGPVTVRTSLPGQVGVITFDATAGQRVSLRSRGQDGFYVTAVAPNGDVVRERQWFPPNFTVSDLELRQAGTFSLLVESPDGAPASFTMEVTAQ